MLVDVISDFGSVTIEGSHFSHSMTSLPFLRASSTVSGSNPLTSETKRIRWVREWNNLLNLTAMYWKADWANKGLLPLLQPFFILGLINGLKSLNHSHFRRGTSSIFSSSRSNLVSTRRNFLLWKAGCAMMFSKRALATIILFVETPSLSVMYSS